MDQETINTLNDINREFYRITAAEFDQTRGQAWQGWQEMLKHITPPSTVLDVGCGNGRFGRFLAESFPDQQIHYHGIDSNPSLLNFAQQELTQIDNLTVKLEERDIVSTPISGYNVDLLVLFGVIHHIPGTLERQRFIQQLAEQINTGGFLVFAAWCFYENERFRNRLVDWSPELVDKVERHDYLLDWRRGERALRYCHYVDDAEHTQLIKASALQEIAQYRADGANNALNRYSVLSTSR